MNKFLLLGLCYLGIFSASAQKGLYDIDKVQEIKIVFGYNDWNAKLQAQKAGNQDYILAKSCTINGVTFDSVGVKYKGNSSYRATNLKNPLHIKLDWKKEQTYHNVNSIKLGNLFSDPSYIREQLSYKLLSTYMDCPRANYARVYIEGNYYGLMSNIEPINNKFVSDHFGSSENAFVKCNPKYGAGAPGGTSIPNLAFLGRDSSLYMNRYELENPFGWKELIELTDTIANNPKGLSKILDVDRAIWMLAFNNVFVNLDSYTGSFAQNYYLYKDNNGRFAPIVWDLNMSFGSFTATGAAGGGAGGGSSTSLIKMEYDLHRNNAARPLIKAILSNPTYEKMYVAHMRTMLKDYFSNKEYENQAKALQAFIEPEVKTDVNAQSTYASFQTSMTATGTSGPGMPGRNVIGISTLMNGRTAYLNDLPKFKAQPPAITSFAYAPQAAKIGETIFVTAKISALNNALLAYREDSDNIFEKTPMFDDGLHGDGMANDSVFGAAVVVKDYKMSCYIYAENNEAGAFSPERAEHEFHTLAFSNSGSSSVLPGELVINELMASNQNTVLDPSDGKADDWAELYNNTSSTISLDNLYMTDDFTKKDKWQFPAGLSIPPKGRLVVWLDEDGKATTGIHASFKLSSIGEELMLTKADGTVLDSIVFGALAADQSMERCPDGTGNFVLTPNPTFNAINCKPLSAEEIFTGETFIVYPNPTTESFTIQGPEVNSAAIFDIQGNLCWQTEDLMTDRVSISSDQLPNGFYLLIINNRIQKKLVVLRK